MSAASHRGVDGPIITGAIASSFMVDRDDEVANRLLQTDRERLNELHENWPSLQPMHFQLPHSGQAVMVLRSVILQDINKDQCR